MNLAHQFAVRHYGSVEQAKHENEGSCIDFAGELVDSTPGARLAYFDDPANRYNWKYHAAMVLNGVVHDLWEENAMPLSAYMERIGVTEVEYPAEEAI